MYGYAVEPVAVIENEIAAGTAAVAAGADCEVAVAAVAIEYYDAVKEFVDSS